MILIFEEHKYDYESLAQHIPDTYIYRTDSITAKVSCVGYYYNFTVNKSIFILPKVFIKNGLAFGQFDIESLLLDADITLSNKESSFIFNLSIWLYKAIKVFKDKTNAATSADERTIQIVSQKGNNYSSYLDIVLSLLSFYRKNQKLFTQIHFKTHSYNHKINWRKTISNKKPFIQNNNPIYLDIISSNRVPNFEEELLVIFYSILTDLKQKFGFKLNIPVNYPLYKNEQYERLINTGVKTLKRIKYKYFSDKLIELWNLLYIYLDKVKRVRSSKTQNEALLISNFNLVFEDMVDTLLSDTDIPTYLKNHKDGKRLDHIYEYHSLIGNDSIYYIGDSKYYKETTPLSENSEEKQFTYARNVIQYNIEDKEKNNTIKYRDTLTEGYNVTPNFFIYAILDDDLSFWTDGLSLIDKSPYKKEQFPNRLFDRSTLFVHSYTINFLYVLANYTSQSTITKHYFKDKAKRLFYETLVSFLEKQYRFYLLDPLEDINVFVYKNFKVLNGISYRTSRMEEEKRILIALPKNDKLIANTLKKLRNNSKYKITDITLYDLT